MKHFEITSYDAEGKGLDFTGVCRIVAEDEVTEAVKSVLSNSEIAGVAEVDPEEKRYIPSRGFRKYYSWKDEERSEIEEVKAE